MYTLFRIYYWCTTHYIVHITLALIILLSCLSCSSTRTLSTATADTTASAITRDTIYITRTIDSSQHSASLQDYEREIINLQARLDSTSGIIYHDTIRIERERWHKRDTLIVTLHDTLHVTQQRDSVVYRHTYTRDQRDRTSFLVELTCALFCLFAIATAAFVFYFGRH